MPGNANEGMIEDLCLLSVKDHPLMSPVEEFMLRVEKISQNNAPKNKSKAKVQAFLAAMVEPVPYLGIAAQRKYWPLENEAFADLRHFIRQLHLLPDDISEKE